MDPNISSFVKTDPILLAELILENASAPMRTRVSAGCATMTKSMLDHGWEHSITLQVRRRKPVAPVPAPRLVGIETNPGPNPPRSRLGALRSDLVAAGLAAAGAAAGMAAGRRRGGVATTKKKKSTKKRATQQNMPAPRAPLRQAGVPTGTGIVVRGQARGANQVVPFCVTGFSVTTNGAGATSFTPLNGTTSFQAFTLDVNDPTAPFGIAVARIASAYVRWRLRRLIIRYRPACSTSVSGGLALAYLPDGRFSDGIIPYTTVGDMLASDSSILVSPWIAAEIPNMNRNLDTAWKFVADPTTLGAAENAQDHAGLVCTRELAVLAVLSQPIGVLELEGELEFNTLRGNLAIPAQLAPTQAASSASALPALRVEQDDPVHVCTSCRH